MEPNQNKPRPNTLALVTQVVKYLAEHDVTTVICGGWAEELHGLAAPRLHKDIDLLFAADNFQRVDELIAHHNLPEIQAKHFHHKRAFLYQEVMVELLLVECDHKGYFTNFWGTKKYRWPSSWQQTKNSFGLASPRALQAYRRDYQLIDRVRQQGANSPGSPSHKSPSLHHHLLL